MTWFGIAMIALGALFVGLAWRRHRAKLAECAAAARTWQQTEATIRACAIRERIDRDSEGDESVTFVPEATYAYRAGGREFEGTRVWLARDAFSNKREADAWLAAHPVGARVAAWCDPADPARSTLAIDRPSLVTFLAFAAVGAVFAGVGAIFLLF